MFNIICGFLRNDKVGEFKVEIEGCPYNGVEAVDFRRKHGLPEEPTNVIELPGRIFNNEVICRKLKNMDRNADVNLEYIYQYGYKVNATGQVYKQQTRMLLSSNYLSVLPKTIVFYLGCNEVRSAELLIRDVLDYENRSKKQAEKEATKVA